MSRSDSAIDEEAADWVTRLADGEFDPEEPFPDLIDRNNAFVQWVSQSHEHQRALLKMYEMYRMVERIDLRAAIQVEELLAKRNANVIPLHPRRRPPLKPSLYTPARTTPFPSARRATTGSSPPAELAGASTTSTVRT